MQNSTNGDTPCFERKHTVGIIYYLNNSSESEALLSTVSRSLWSVNTMRTKACAAEVCI